MRKIGSICVAALLAVALLAGCAAANSQALELTRGTVEGDTYTSEFAGITFTLPEGWIFGTDQELAELMNMTADTMAEEGQGMTAEMMKQQTIFDMMAKDPATGNNVLVQIENLAASMSTNMTVEQYVDVTIESTAGLAGYDFAVGETSAKTLSGQEYTYLPIHENTYGFDQNLFVRKVDKYMVNVMVTLMNSDTDLDAILGQFS